MRKVHIVGKSEEKIEEMKKKLSSRGFEIADENPELVISYGGDGMFLISERVFPGIPKISLRDSEVGNMTHDLDICEVIDLYLEEKYQIEELIKIKGIWKGKFETRELIGLNDIVIRNVLPTEAIRFRYKTNESDWSKTLIGDGLVISTPYGSNKGAYFYSITRKKFEKGLGIAFNNVTEEEKPLYISKEDKIEIEIIRGNALMVADNNRDYINLESKDKIIVHLTKDTAKRILLKK